MSGSRVLIKRSLLKYRNEVSQSREGGMTIGFPVAIRRGTHTALFLAILSI